MKYWRWIACLRLLFRNVGNIQCAVAFKLIMAYFSKARLMPVKCRSSYVLRKIKKNFLKIAQPMSTIIYRGLSIIKGFYKCTAAKYLPLYVYGICAWFGITNCHMHALWGIVSLLFLSPKIYLIQELETLCRYA